MNTIEIHEVNPNARIISVADTAMYLNLMYTETVEEILEVFTDFTDFDIIAELVDTLNLPLTAVIEPTNQGQLIHGYIREGALAWVAEHTSLKTKKQGNL